LPRSGIPRAPQAIVLSRNSGTYVVDGNVPDRGFSQQFLGIWKWAAQELGLQEAEQHDLALTEASVRDFGGFSTPLLAGKQLLSEGTRTLTVSWPGKAATARVEIAQANGELIASGNSSGGIWRSGLIHFVTGTYKIIVMPKSGSHIVTTVEVIPASSLPKFPQDSKTAELPAEFVDTIRATWLAARGPQFKLEAYQIVVTIADRYHPAELLKQTLLEGRLPRKPF